MARTRVLIDTDPGVDDAVAISLALASPELEVVGLTTVAGNVPVELTTLNARRILSMAKRDDVAVFRGCDRPLCGVPLDARTVHGDDGLGDLVWDEPVVPESAEGAVDAMGRLAREGPLTLIAIGPLTNLASAIARNPTFVEEVERVVVMGGASWHGNVTPAAEFNVFSDPEAARTVFGAPWSVTILPLDLTHQAFLTLTEVAELRASGNETGRRLAAMLERYARFHLAEHRSGQLYLHDATAVYEVLAPGAIDSEPVAVEVETAGEFSRGATWFHRSHRHERSRVRVGTRIDNARFTALLLERLASCP